MALSDTPPPPSGVVAESAPGRVELHWKPVLSRPPAAPVARYHVFRGPSPTGAVQELGTVEAGEAPEFTDVELLPEARSVYLITAESVDGRQGPAAGPIPVAGPATVLVTFEVSVPEATPPVYLAGDYFNDWDPGFVPMRPIEIGRWQHVQPFPVGIVIAYKYTLGSWDTVEVSAAGEDMPNRTLTTGEADLLVDDTVAAWRTVA